MSAVETPLECVAFMVIMNGCILVERRAVHKRLLPGILAIPGGHVEADETVAAALVREVREELSITPLRFVSICTLLHRAEEYRRLHYFAVEQWAGELMAQEAVSLHWLPLDAAHTLPLDIDVTAITTYCAQA